MNAIGPPDGRGAYRIGETVSVRVAFDRSVRVDENAGSPSLALTIGGRERQAIYSHGSNTGDLVFLYRIKDGDTDADGIAVAVDGLALNDAAITDADNNPAVLKLPGLPDRPGQRIDGERPTLVATRAVAVAGGAVSMAFDEPLDEHSIPAIGAFSVVGQEAAYSVTSVSVEGESVRLALSPAVPDTETFVSVSYLEPAPAAAESIRDGVGNAAASFVSDWYAQQPDAVSRTSRAAGEPRAAEKESIADILARKALRTPAQRKVSSQLLDARRAQVRDPATTAEPGGRQATGATDERVLVDIRADVTAEVLARIRELGGTVVNSVPRYRSVRAELPLAAVESLAELDEVQAIRPADMPVTHRPLPGRLSVVRAEALDVVRSGKEDTTEGDVAHQADVARSTYGVDGTGIGVGVISDGVETLADQQATGDVAERVTVLPGQEGGPIPFACGGRSNGSEGTALLEIVHDLAPGAELFFADGISGSAQMAQNIEDLCTAGADIIVDDIKYLGAAFQDDVIARAVSTAVANGCHYFSSAGNGGNKNDETASVWEGDFAAGSALDLIGVGSGLVVHDFGGGVTGNEITKDSTLSIVLEWSDPAGGSANDYDLFLIGPDNLVNSGSANTQDGTQDPIESIRSSCSPNREGDRLVIIKNAGAEDRYLRLSYAPEGLAITTAGHTFGHTASQDAIGVAAVDVADAGGADGVFDGTESVETYSSDGPRRIFFEADGTPITPGNFSSTGGRVLQKPDLAAADGVSTSTPGFSTFRGTSAAAPHAAAIAALMLEAAGGSANVTQDDLRAAMTGTALDIEAMGVDRDSGAGIVMAPGAVDAVDIAATDRNGAPTVASAPADQTLAPGGDAVTIELAGVFSDPDDDPLTYTVWLSNAERLSLSGLTGTAFTLTPLAPGRYVVTVVATDPEGLSAVLTFEVTVTVGDRDYDADDDGLIEVGNLAQLHAMRFDLDGDGLVDEPANWSQYHDHAAFVEGSWDMGCPAGCSGYELTADLDFDTDGDGDIGAGDDYWNNGRGWRPVGAGNAFRATFEGNGHTVSNLFIHRNRYAGLFGTVVDGVVRGVGLLDVDVTGGSLVGGLVGYKGDGEISGSYVTGSVSGDDYVGGLVGRSGAPFVDDESHSAVTGSYSTAHVSGREFVGGLVGLGSVITASFATGHVEGTESVGGLVGRNDHPITASYATGRVEGRENVGGLVGFGTGRTTITAGYATGLVSGDEKVGGLVGWDRRTKAERFSASYWDIHTSGHAIGPRGRTTTELQAPTDYGGIYRTWNADLDDDTVANDPWDFGSSAQYPVLAVDLDGNGEATWKEFGHQLRAGPVLMASTSAGQPVVLTWSAADTSHWNPPPELAYTLIRDDGTTVEILASNLAGLRYTDSDVTAGAAYTYQVAAVVDGGAPARSALVEIVAGVANQPPMIVVGTLRDRTLQVGATEVVDVAGAFSDLDDALTYAASSSDVDVATVSVSGAQVTITPVAPGRTTITVTATDAGGSNTTVTHRFQLTTWTGTGVDYDADNDGLIDIATLAQLDAVRYDLDGDGVPVHRELEAGFSVEVEPVVYAEAFPAAATGMGCPSGGGCTGYELETDLDFDTNGDGRADAGDEYWDHGKGWEPISEVGFAFRAVFEGNRHTIRNLFIRRFTGGLFGGNAGVIRRVRLIDVDVSATAWVGGLVAQSRGEIHASYVTGRVAGEDWVGGLVGSSFGGLAGTSGGGTITASYSTARVTGTDKWVGGLVGVNSGAISGSYATGRVSGYGQVGGLIGCHIRRGSVVASYATGIVSGRGDVGGLIGSTECSAGSPVVTASYATGRVSGRSNVGGLIGLHCGSLAAGYATGPVWGGSHVGGLIGSTECSAGSAVVTASYWDTVTSGLSSSAAGTGQTTSALQAPTDYSGAIYADWNVDLDGNGTNDDPWDFGTGSQYPALKMNFDGQGATTWQEFGRQLRAGPTLTAEAGATGVTLIWTVDTSHWSPAPAVTYTLYRDGRTGVKILAENLSGLGYTDTDVTVGETYTYGVAAVITGGEATRSAVVVDLSVNSPPVPAGTLPDRWLHVGDAAGVEAGEAFEDPEDDALTYTAASSTTGVATVSVSGTRVTITPVAAGTATITVTATDAGGSSASTTQAFTVTVLPSSAIDYDTDDDGLIEISNLAQLDAVRHDLNGSGRNFDAGHAEAFPDGGDVLACGGLLGCVGYELNADLDFDTDRSGEADAGDAYWNDGAGWAPIGDSSGSFSGFGAIFEGNGRTIAHLFIDSSENDIGLFGATRSAAVIRNLEMVAVLVTGTDNVGGLVGSNGGAVSGCYATGKVSGDDIVGGLVGANLDDGSASASYSTVQVTGDDRIGGLAGSNSGEVTAAYATGRVVGDTEAGGLLGRNTGDVNVSYATGLVSGGSKIGGLVGDNTGGGTITDSNWDTDTSGWTTGSGGQGQTTAELQLPTAASGIYQTWNLDLDGDAMNDDPWDFGTSSQYPALKANFDGQGTATWQEFGQQIRAGPALMATPTAGQVTLTWSVISGGTYSLYRTSGTTVEILSENTSSHTYVDTDVTAGATYVYQVAAVINGGEASRSPRVSVVGPMMGALPTVTLQLMPTAISENRGSATVTARLSPVSTETTTVTVSAAAVAPAVEGDFSLSTNRTLTITAGQTSSTGTVTITANNNNVDAPSKTVMVMGTATNSQGVTGPSDVTLNIIDDDSPAVLVTPDALTVVEAESDTYAVELQTRPTADVTVTITGVSGDLSLDRTSLVFTQADWRDPRDVRVTAADDADSVPDAEVTLTHRASGAAEYEGLRAQLVVSIRENDPGLVFSESALRVPEGQTATYTVALATVPTAAVTVRVTGVSGDLSLDRTRLDFTGGDWNSAQTVTVRAAEDDDTSTDPSVTLTHEASGGGYDGIVGSVRVSVTENDGGGTGGGSGGGGGANRPPVVEREIDDQTLDAGEVLELDIRLNFYDRDQRALDYSVESADPSVATVAVDRNGVLTIRGVSRGVTAITVTVADRRDERASDTFLVAVKGPALVALLPRAADPVREGFVRVINHAAEAGEVTIEAVDDTGMRLGPVTLSVDAGATVHFNSGDLEDGNADKGLPTGVGSGEGDWRLVLNSDLDFEALSYIRTADGFLTAMHDTVPVRDGAYEVAIFNPGSNPNQVSGLRLVNLGAEDAQVTITGIDDAGVSPGSTVALTVPAGASRSIEAADLEAGAEGFDGSLGDGLGKWRLRVESDQPIVVMSLLSSPTGHLTNLSSVPDRGPY